MVTRTISLFLIFHLSLYAAAKPRGVNCAGSSICGGLWIQPDSRGSTNLIEQFQIQVLSNLSAIYTYGVHIACAKTPPLGGVCLFLQGVGLPDQGVNGSVVYGALGFLKAHGCTKCGSVPLSGNNDPRELGILTSNYVISEVCEGLCHWMPKPTFTASPFHGKMAV